MNLRDRIVEVLARPGMPSMSRVERFDLVRALVEAIEAPDRPSFSPKLQRSLREARRAVERMPEWKRKAHEGVFDVTRGIL